MAELGVTLLSKPLSPLVAKGKFPTCRPGAMTIIQHTSRRDHRCRAVGASDRYLGSGPPIGLPEGVCFE